MPRDYEDVEGLDQLNDRDLRERIEQEFEEYPELEGALVEVRVDQGQVTLAGRVGSESEYQQLEHIVTDVLGIKDVSNELVVDELVRAEYSEAADEARAQRIRAGGPAAAASDATSDTADHLLEDTASEQFGTRDMREAIERGHSYQPPPGPIQEGTESRENH